MDFKKIGIATISAFALSFSTITFAGGPEKIPPAAENPYFFMSIGGNYWKPADPETTWAVESTQAGMIERFFTLQPEYDWGVNAKIGYFSADKKTSFYFLYHYLSAKSTQTASPAGTNEVITIIPQESEFITQISSASLTAKYCFHQLEALADHEVWQGHHFSVNVFGGLGFAYNKRTLTRFAQGEFDFTGNPGSETVNNTNKFWALGPEGGTRVTLNITPHFGIYTQFAGAAMAGDITDSANDTARDITGQTATRNLSIKREAMLIPMLSSETGIKWSVPIGHEDRTIDFLVAYRFVTFINVISGGNVFNVPTADSNNMSYHGLVFNMGFTV